MGTAWAPRWPLGPPDPPGRHVGPRLVRQRCARAVGRPGVSWAGCSKCGEICDARAGKARNTPLDPQAPYATLGMSVSAVRVGLRHAKIAYS